MHVSCPGGTIAAGDAGLTEVDLAFTVDASGTVQPTAGHTIGFLEQTDCTITETGTGGATSVSYACTGSGAVRTWTEGIRGGRRRRLGLARAPRRPRTPTTRARPRARRRRRSGSTSSAEDQAATVTVTNTMPAVAAVLVTPRFTG